MKILVAVKRTVDANIKVRVKPDHGAVDLEHVKMAMNPFCEIAVEEAVRLKERGLATETVVVTIGGEKSREQLQHAMALGIDRAIRVEGETELEPLATAEVLSKVVEREQPDLIILGKQAIDTDNNQVGQMLAALCGYPQGTFAFRLELETGRAIVGREIDGGEQTVSLLLPAVITTDLRLNEPRYAKLPDIMKARKKPIDTLNLAELGVTVERHMEVLSVEEPPARGGNPVMVSTAAELVQRLKEQKVLP